MCAGLAELGDDVGDRLADAGDLREPVLDNEHIERDRKGRQAVSSPRIGFCPIWVSATQGGALRIFSQETSHCANVDGGHPTSLPSHSVRPRCSKATLIGSIVIAPII